jgi:hypothetical protein
MWTFSGSIVAAGPPPWYSIRGTNIHPIVGALVRTPSRMFWRSMISWRSRGSDQFVSR